MIPALVSFSDSSDSIFNKEQHWDLMRKQKYRNNGMERNGKKGLQYRSGHNWCSSNKQRLQTNFTLNVDRKPAEDHGHPMLPLNGAIP